MRFGVVLLALCVGTALAASDRYYVRLMFLVDPRITTARFTNQTVLEHFLKVTSNQVDWIYRHESLGEPGIRAVYVGYEVMEPNLMASLLSVDENFALHQLNMWRRHFIRRFNTNHVALLLDPVTMQTHRLGRKVGGLAVLNNFCTHGSSLIRYQAFQTAVVVAHEIGHTLGLDHIYHETNAIMTPTRTVVWRSQNLKWSKKSARQLKKSLRRHTRCMRKKPSKEIIQKQYITYPFMRTWHLSNWCQMYHGNPNLVYSESCYSSENERCQKYRCKDVSTGRCEDWSLSDDRKMTRPLDGTRCSHEKVCHQGRCVMKKEAKKTYSKWSPCSTTCGTGIMRRRRLCSYLDISCQNEEEVRTCTIQGCTSKVLFSKYDLCKTNIKDDSEPCSAKCLFQNNIIRTIIAKNGSPCHGNEKGTCIDGICQEIDCLGTVNGTTRYDVCGKCGGVNSTCVLRRDAVTSNERESIASTDVLKGSHGFLVKINCLVSRSCPELRLQIRSGRHTFITYANLCMPTRHKFFNDCYVWTTTEGTTMRCYNTLSSNMSLSISRSDNSSLKTTTYAFVLMDQQPLNGSYYWHAQNTVCKSNVRPWKRYVTGSWQCRMTPNVTGLPDRECTNKNVSKPTQLPITACGGQHTYRWCKKKGPCRLFFGQMKSVCLKINHDNEEQEEVNEANCKNTGPKPRGGYFRCFGISSIFGDDFGHRASTLKINSTKINSTKLLFTIED